MIETIRRLFRPQQPIIRRRNDQHPRVHTVAMWATLLRELDRQEVLPKKDSNSSTE